MAYRVTTYQQAFEGELEIVFGDKLKAFVARMEREGHTEKSICYVVWKKQDKLNAFKRDPRFMGILENEINNWSWKKDDPRWQEYWKRKNEEERAKRIREEIDNAAADEAALKLVDRRATKPPKKHKGYVYFIQGVCGGSIKIGYSLDPAKRLKELQTGYPDTLTILLMIPGSEAIERALHRTFEASRLKGEWFRPDGCVIEKIKELKVKYNQCEE